MVFDNESHESEETTDTSAEDVYEATKSALLKYRQLDAVLYPSFQESESDPRTNKIANGSTKAV